MGTRLQIIFYLYCTLLVLCGWLYSLVWYFAYHMQEDICCDVVDDGNYVNFSEADSRWSSTCMAHCLSSVGEVKWQVTSDYIHLMLLMKMEFYLYCTLLVLCGGVPKAKEPLLLLCSTRQSHLFKIFFSNFFRVLFLQKFCFCQFAWHG